jgi:Bacterial Ig domain
MLKTASPALILILMGLLGGCQQEQLPLSVSISTPALNATVAGTSAVVLSVPDGTKISAIRVYVRGRGEKGSGVLVGTANKAPYVVPWNTASVPNGEGLELYAVATGPDNAQGTSDPVPVGISNPDAPVLNYLVTYNLPQSVQAQGGRRTAVPPRLDPAQVSAPAAINLKSQALTPQDTPPEPGRDLAAEWAWNPYTEANGYQVLLSTNSRAGPYELVRAQVAVATGTQKHSQTITGAKVGATLYGAVAALSNNAQDKSSLSNAGSSTFLPVQQLVSPLEAQTVQDGRPILTWTPLAGADAYLFFLCDKVCSRQDAKDLWTNNPKAQPAVSVLYPASRAALSSGTYYWWVAGVKFNAQRQAIGFSYSPIRQLVVP